MKRIVLDTNDLKNVTYLGTALDDNANKYHKFEYKMDRITFITYDPKFTQALEDNQLEHVQLNCTGVVAKIRHYACKKIRLKRSKRKRCALWRAFSRKKAYIGAQIPQPLRVKL